MIGNNDRNLQYQKSTENLSYVTLLVIFDYLTSRRVYNKLYYMFD